LTTGHFGQPLGRRQALDEQVLAAWEIHQEAMSLSGGSSPRSTEPTPRTRRAP
jgi:hypothetical protein